MTSVLIENLNKANKKILRGEISQNIVMFMAAAIIALVLFIVFYVVIFNGELSNLPFPPMKLFWFAVIIFLIGYFFLLIRKIKMLLLDLLKGKKKIIYDKIFKRGKQ